MSTSIFTLLTWRSTPLVVLDAADGGEPQVRYLDMAAKLDHTAESICGPTWAIARDLTVYKHVSSGKGGVNADRGPPMVSGAQIGTDVI